MWTKIGEFVYDCIVFTVFMLAFITAFICFMTVITQVATLEGAPAPFAKNYREKWNRNALAGWYGFWEAKPYPGWKMHFMPGGAYTAVYGEDRNPYEGTWRVSNEDGSVKIIIIEHPVNQPDSDWTLNISADDFSRHVPKVDF